MMRVTYEDNAADDVIQQGCPDGIAVNPGHLPTAAIRRGYPGTIRRLRGETTTPPGDHHGRSAYAAAVPMASPAPRSGL
jgi:hypothetical protein